MNAIETVETVLRQNHLFSSLNEDELDELGRLASTVSVSSDAVLFSEGDEGNHLFVIITGTVRLCTLDSNGRVQPTALLTAGQAFGEMSVLDGSKRSATATATADSSLARIERDDLDRLAARFPDSKSKILREGMRLVSARLRKSNARFWDLARDAMRQKRNLTQSRARFLSLVSHELRTPLAIVKSSAQLMLRSPHANRPAHLGKIVAQCNHLAHLVDDLITFSLLQSDAKLQNKTDFDAVSLARQVIAGLTGAANDRSVQLSLTTSMEPLRFSGDPMLIARALYHLIDNAVKFSRPSSEVTISLQRDEAGRNRLSVSDHGDGIPPNRLATLLQSFVQAQGPLNRDVEGMGIGLSLVDEVARAHRGRLSVDSVPGRGSCFTIVLPHEPETTNVREESVVLSGGQQ